MTKSAKIIFFGNERLSTGFKPVGSPTLQALIDNGYDVVAIVANFEAAKSRNARPLEIADIANKHGIPLFTPKNLSTLKDKLVELNADVAVLVAYGQIIPQSIIDIFPKGIVNLHPSLLPEYRGPTPIEQAMLDGRTRTGVSIMQLAQKMDAGPIYVQTEIALSGHETKSELTDLLLQKGKQLIADNLESILDGGLKPKPQDETKATYCKLLTKKDGLSEPEVKTAQQIEREVRAFAGWPKSKIKLLENFDVIITRARVVDDFAAGKLVVPCAQQTWLEVLELIAPSGKKMSGQDFLRGYQK